MLEVSSGPKDFLVYNNGVKISGWPLLLCNVKLTVNHKSFWYTIAWSLHYYVLIMLFSSIWQLYIYFKYSTILVTPILCNQHCQCITFILTDQLYPTNTVVWSLLVPAIHEPPDEALVLWLRNRKFDEDLIETVTLCLYY